MDSDIVVRNERMRPAEKQEAGNITQHCTAIGPTLAHAAAQLGTQEYCEGSASTLVYLDLRLPELGWRAQHADMAAWFERMSTRPSMCTSLTE